MRLTRILSPIIVLVLALTSTGFAKDKSTEDTLDLQNNQGFELSNPVLEDAIRLCDLLVIDDRAILDALENEGWTHEINRTTGNAPFYKELSADRTYDNVGGADIWGFMENYPGYDVGYCAFTISNPSVDFSLEQVNALTHFTGEVQFNGNEVYGAWVEISENPTGFIHAYRNSDTFVYQITRYTKVN